VHDTTEPDVSPVSSDDYAASSADISSSSSSNEDNSDAVCRQPIVREEMPSDQISPSVVCIPSSVPFNDGSVTTVNLEDGPRMAFGMQNLQLGCSTVDLWSNVDDVADASQQSDDAIQPLEANSPTVTISEQNLSALEGTLKSKFPPKLTQSQTLVVDTLASSQSWIPVSSAVMSGLQDVLPMTEQDSDNTISSEDDEYLPCSMHVDAAAYFHTEMLPASSLATEIPSVVQETGSDAALIGSAEHQQQLDVDSTHLPVECAGIDITESEDDTSVHSGLHRDLCLANTEVAGDICSDSSLMTAPEEDHPAVCKQWRDTDSESHNVLKNVSTCLAEVVQAIQHADAGVTAFVGEAGWQNKLGSDDDEFPSDVDADVVDSGVDEGQMSEYRTNEANQISVNGISDYVNHSAAALQQAAKFNNVVGFSDVDDWTDSLVKCTALPIHSDDTVEVVGKDKQESSNSSNKTCIMEASVQYKSDIIQLSATEVRDAREESTSCESLSFIWRNSVTDSSELYEESCEKYVTDESGEGNEMVISSGTRQDNRHLLPSKTADQSVSIVGRAVVEMHSDHDQTSGDTVHALSFSDKTSSETVRLYMHQFPDQLSPGSESNRATVLEAEESRGKPETDDDEVDSTETKESSPVTRNFGGDSIDHCSSALFELAVSSLPVSEDHGSSASSGVDCGNTELGRLAASGNVDSEKETMAGEQKAATVLANCDISVAISTVLADSTAGLDSQAESLLGTVDHEVRWDVVETGRDSSSSGELSVSGLSTDAVGPDRADRQTELNLTSRDQSKAVDDRSEENRNEVSPDMSTEVVAGDCGVLKDAAIADAEYVLGSSSLITVTGSYKANNLVDSERDIGAQCSLDMIAVIDADIQTVVPMNTSALLREKNNVHSDFAGKEECAVSAAAPHHNNAVREVNVAVAETGADSGQKEIAQHTQFSLGKHDVRHSSSVKQQSCGQCELTAAANKEAVSAELILTDAVGNGLESAVCLDIVDKTADSCVEDICDTRLDQQLVTEGSALIMTAESLMESLTTVREEPDDLLDQFLPHNNVVETDLPLLQTNRNSVNIGVDDEAGRKPCKSLIKDAADQQAEAVPEQNDGVQESLPQRAVLVQFDMMSQLEESAAKFHAAGLSDDGRGDELLRCPALDVTANSTGESTSIIAYPSAFEGINSSTSREKLDAESSEVIDEDGSVIQQLNEPPSSTVENYHCPVGSAKDHLAHAVDDSFVTTVDSAVVMPDSPLSDCIKDESGKTDANMVVVADKTGDIAVSAVADTSIVPVSSSADLGAKKPMFEAVAGFENSLQGEHGNESQSVRNDNDSEVAMVQVYGSGGDDLTGSIVPSQNSGDTDVAHVAELQVELTSGSEVRCIRETDVVTCWDAVEQIQTDDLSDETSLVAVVISSTCDADTSFPATVIHVTQETTELLNSAATYSVQFAVFLGKINDSDSIDTVSANGTSDQIASSLAASGLTETEEFKISNGQNPANVDVCVTDTDTALHRLPQSDVSQGFDMLSITDSSVVDPGTSDMSSLKMQRSEEDASIMSPSSQKSAGDGTDASGGGQDEAVISDVTGDAEHGAEGCIQDDSACENEVVKTAAVVVSVITTTAAESIPFLADDVWSSTMIQNGSNDDNSYARVTQHKAVNSSADGAKQTEFINQSRRPGSVADVCGYSAVEGTVYDEDTDHADTDSVTEKMISCGANEHEEMTVQFDSLLPEITQNVDIEGQIIAAGNRHIATDTYNDAVVAVNLKNITKNTLVAVDITAEVSEFDQISFHHDRLDSTANTCITAALKSTGQETSVVTDNDSVDRLDTTNRAESINGDSKAYSVVDGSKIALVNSAVDMPVHVRSELQVLFSETTASSRDIRALSSSPVRLTNGLQKQSDDNMLCDAHDSGSVNVNSITDYQCIAAFDKDSQKVVKEVAVIDKSENVIRNATADSSHGSVAGTGDSAVVQDLAKNISDVATDAREKWQSLTDDGPGQVTPSTVSVIAHAAHIGSDVTALVGVTDLPEQPPDADESSAADKLPADKCLENIGSCQQHGAGIATSTCAIDESELSAVKFCHCPAPMSSAEHQTELLVSTPLQASLQNEIQLFETVSSSLVQVSNTAWRNGITVTDETFFDENASLGHEMSRGMSVLEEKDKGAEQVQRYDCTTADHMNGAAALGTDNEAGAASDSVLQIGQTAKLNKLVDSLIDEESCSSLSTVHQSQKRNEGDDELIKEQDTGQKLPIVLHSPAVIGSPDQETVCDGVTNTEPHHDDTEWLHFPEDAVTNALVFGSDLEQDRKLAGEIMSNCQIQERSGVGHATTIQAAVDTDVVAVHQQTSAKPGISGLTVSHNAPDDDGCPYSQQEPVNVMATAVLSTPEGVSSADVVTNDQHIIDERVISRYPVLTDDRSRLDLPENTVENAEKNGLLISTPVSDQFDISTPPSDYSYVPEAGIISLVSAANISVVQADDEFLAGKDSRDSPFSTVIGDKSSHQQSGLPGVVNGGSSRVMESTGEMDQMADDLMVAACLQHDVTLAREQHSSDLIFIANQPAEDVGIISTNEISRLRAFDKTDRKVTGFCEVNRENDKDADADKASVSNQRTVVCDLLSAGDDGYLVMNDSVNTISCSWTEQLATADTYSSASRDLTNVRIGDDISKSKGTAHSHLKSVALSGLNVYDIQRTSMADHGNAGMLSAHTVDQAENVDQCGSGGNTYDVTVVADSDMLVKSNQQITVPNDEFACAGHDQLFAEVTAHKLDDSEYSSELMSRQIQPQLAVSHPSRAENVRTGSRHKSEDNTALLHSASSQVAESVTFADSLAVQMKSDDGRVQHSRSSNVKKTKLTDTEVLGIDLEPERQHSIVESSSVQSPDVEIIMSGHSTIGLGRRTDFEYHSVGLQPVGTQRPKFTPGPEQVLRNEMAEQYPESFWHSALDIEIRPQNRTNLSGTRDEAQITVSGAAVVRNKDGARTRSMSDKSDTDFHREVKDSVVITQQNRSKSPLRGVCVVTDRYDGHQTTVGCASSAFNDSLVDTLQGLSNGKPEHCQFAVNRDAARSHNVSHQFPASWHPAGSSQIFDVGLDLFRSKSMDHIEFADIQPDCWRVRSHPDLSTISARRSCCRRHRRRLAQPMSANSSLSKSDQELLGSTSALFEDLLPNFKDLPFCSSLDGSDSESDENKQIRGESGQFENFLLPQYCNLPSVPGNYVEIRRSNQHGGDPAVRITSFDIAAETMYDDNIQNSVIRMPFGQMMAETGLCPPHMTPVHDYKNYSNALKHAASNELHRTQSTDSITYVFVGHGASSLEAVGGNRSRMVRFSSEPSTYPCDAAADTLCRIPGQSHPCGVSMLMEASSDSCLLTTNNECPTPIQRSLSCTGLCDQNVDSGGFSDELTSDIGTGHHQMPTTPYQSDFEHNEAGMQALDRVRLCNNEASLATSGHGEIAVQTSESLCESDGKQTSLSFSSTGRGQMEAETQTHENRQQYPDSSGDLDPLSSGSNGSGNIGKHLMHGDKYGTTVPLQSDQMVQSDTVNLLTSVAAGCHLSDMHPVGTHPVNESLLSKEQSIVGAYRQMLQSGDIDRHQSMKKNPTVQNWPHDEISSKTFSTQSLLYRTDDQDQLSTENILQSSSVRRTIETQTYPEMRAIETQTPNVQETCGTQTLTDVESVPLTVFSPASSPELHTPPVNMPRIELLSPSTAVVSSPLMLPTASSMPVIMMSADDPENASHLVVSNVRSGFSIDGPSVTAVNHSVTDQVSSVAALIGSDTTERWNGHLCERSSDTTSKTNVSPHQILSQDPGLLHKSGAQTAQGGSTPLLLQGEGFPSHGSDLGGYHEPVQTDHSVTLINSSILTSTDFTSDIHSKQTTVNAGRLLAVNTTDKNLQPSATLSDGVIDVGLPSHQYQTADMPNVTQSGRRLSDSSSTQSLSSTLSPASNSESEVIRTEDSLWSRMQEEENESKLMADKILEKYRMKRTANAQHIVRVGNERSACTPQCSDRGRLPLSAVRPQESLSFSQANDSGIVDSRQSLSPLTRTLLGYSDVSCDKSTVKDARRRATAGWYDELERLRRERQRIIDMLAQEVIPSRIQVELTEAHLNYLIGQTDTLLQHVGETPPVSRHRDVLEADFRSFWRTRLEACQRHTEAQIQQLERTGKDARRKAARLAANLNTCEQRGALAENLTAEHHSTDSPVCHLCLRTWSPSEREHFLQGIRREIVSETASQPVPPLCSSSSRLCARGFRCSCPNRGHLSAHSSYLNLGTSDSVQGEEPGWCPLSLSATPATSLQHLGRRRHSVLASSVDGEIDSLLTECREARQRAHVEIGRAMDAIQRSAPAWTSSPLSSHRYFMPYVLCRL